jgi:tRNA 2-thiouridine synthesizing protein A
VTDGPDAADGGGGSVIDARGMLCPQPVIELARAMAKRPGTGDEVTLLADDPATVHDVPAWCRMRGCTSTMSQLGDGTYRFVVTRHAVV